MKYFFSFLFSLLLLFLFASSHAPSTFAAVSFSISQNPAKTTDSVTMFLSGCPQEFTKSTLGALFQWKLSQNTRYESGRALFKPDGSAALPHVFPVEGVYEVRADCADKAGTDLTKAQATDAVGTLTINNSISGTSCSTAGSICSGDGDCTKGTGSCGEYVCRFLNPQSSMQQCVQKDTPIPPQQNTGQDPNAPGGGSDTAPESPPICQENDKGEITCGTAVGTLPATPANFVKVLFGSILGMSGGIAVLLIIQAGYVMMTSQGNPEKVKDAQERLTAAVVGLVFLIFSFVIFQIISVDLLGLPGFGS